MEHDSIYEARFSRTFNPRSTNAEVKDVIQSVNTMRDMFKDFGNYNGDLFGVKDYTDGILYLSRINAGGHQSENNIDVDIDRENDEVGTLDLQEEKSERATTIKSHNRDENRRFAMSLATLASKQDKRVKMCEDGAIQALIKLADFVDNPIRRFCCKAFSSLAAEPAIRSRMIEEGCFPAIIQLSGIVGRSAKMDCCRALCNLCCVNGHEHRAVKEGAPYALVQIASACPNIVDVCLKTLINISCVTERYTKMEEVIDTLIIHFSTLHLSQSEDILLIAAMCNLSALRNNQLRMVEDGCMRAIERVLKSNVPKLRILASEVVRNLTTEMRTRSKLMDQNIVATLNGMSKDELEPVKLACVQAFHNLSRDVTCGEKLGATDSVGVIIRMSMERNGNVDRDRIASKTLRILCSNPHLANKLVRDGIVKALMSLIKTDDVSIRQYCAESICSLFQNDSILSRLIDQGAVGVLVSLSHNNTDLITGEWCAFALYHLATNRLCPVSMLANGILPCLIKLCDVSTVRTKQFCSAALRSITQKKTVEASSAISILVAMLRDETDHTVKTNCASSLYNLADSDVHCDLMLLAGALMPVVHLTRSDYLQTKMECAAILSRLSIHEKYYAQFGTVDVLKVLLELTSVDESLTQRRVVIAISNLTRRVDLRGMLLSLNATKFIISLASKPDEHIRRGCSAIICNLASDTGGEKNMVEAGAVSTLLITALVTSDQIETKLVCVKALINLQCNETLYKLMVDQGIIWGLSTLALLDESHCKRETEKRMVSEILTLCAKALCNFSCEYAKQMLSSAVAIKAILTLAKHSSIDMQRAGATALTNLLLQTTDAEVDFRCRAVEATQAMARSTDGEVGEMCILCLCLASQSKSCRTAIVKLGLIRMIDASSIFTKPIISYAYLTMFVNIANDPIMRIELMDEHAINRFMHITRKHDPFLDLAVAKALYAVSCATENIPKLAEQNALEIVLTIWRAEYTKSKDLLHHLVATLFNMTTHQDSQYRLVSQGIVRTFVELWPHAKAEEKSSMLICGALSQLSCGRVNSSQMVEEGCTPLICYISSHAFDFSKFGTAHYTQADLVERCAAALRNLLCVVSNQIIMVRQGVIKTLVDLVPPVNDDIPTKPPSKTVKDNCASALRSMTFNSNLRRELLESGAISIILDETNSGEQQQDIPLGSQLMKEIEAESWSNGSRGRQKERKAKPMDPMPIYVDLLGGTSNVDLDVTSTNASLHKCMVKVELEEPPIEVEGANKQAALGYQDLKSLETDETWYPPSCSQPKQECDIPTEAVVRLNNAELEAGQDSEQRRHSFGSVDTDDSMGDDSLLLETEALVSKDSGSISSSLKSGDKKVSALKDKAAAARKRDDASLAMDSLSEVFGSSSLHTISKRDSISPIQSTANTGRAVAFRDADPGLPAMSLSKSRKDLRKQEKSIMKKLSASLPELDLPEIPPKGAKRGMTYHKKSEMFNGLVSIIKHAKAKGGDMDSVIDSYSSLSKY